MKALSIRQPWAWLILNGGKDIENRVRRTSFRGRILVHAAKGCTRDEYHDACKVVTEINLRTGSQICIPPLEELERGGIVGSVEIIGCVYEHSSPWFFGPFGYELRNPATLPYLQYKGQLGVFNVPDELLQCV